MPANSEEISFNTHGLTIAAKRWNAGAPHKALAIHGWLDNCGSFDPIAPFLKDIEIVALDSVGHGKSDFRSLDSQYLIWSEVSEIFDIADQLKWESFNLIGHSRGANISTICAGTLTQRIEKLVLIEGGVPLPTTPHDAPANLTKHILNDRSIAGSRGTLYPTRDKALAARVDGFIKVTAASAKILAIRALIQDDDGFHWHCDARLKSPSSIRLTPEQVDAFFKEIQCPSLLIEGTDGILNSMPTIAKHLKNIDHLQRTKLAGGHHLHMEESVMQCAQLINKFIQS